MQNRRAAITKLLILTILTILTMSFRVSVATAADDSWGRRVDQMKNLLVQADSLIAAGRGDVVVRDLPGILHDWDLGPEITWPLEQRVGLAYQQLGQHDRALPHFEKAVLWAPRDATNHRNLALTLLNLGKRGRAFSEYRDACSLALDDWAVRVEFGHVLLDYGQGERAAAVLGEASDLCPDCPDVDRALARLHLTRSDYASALPSLTRLHAVIPDDGISIQLALALLRTGDAASARALLLPDWPGDLGPEGRRIVLEADRVLGDDERASALATSRPEGWDDPDLWALAALVCYDSGADEHGLVLVDRAIALAPSVAGYRNNRVAFLLRLGRQAEADEEWALVLQLDPSMSRNRSD